MRISDWSSDVCSSDLVATRQRWRNDRMNIHKNARTTPYSRAEIVRRVMVLRETPRAVATALGVSRRTVATWLARYRAEGEAGLADRSSRPERKSTRLNSSH